MQIITSEIQHLKDKIYTIRGKQVMLDRDLASLYEVTTKVFNQAVKRNSDRFPEDFRFQLSNEEFYNLRSQFVTSSHGGVRYTPYAFTEQGISMLSSILKSDIAIAVSIKIIRLFVQMRKVLNENALLYQRVEKLESQQIQTETKVEKILATIEEKNPLPKEGIFYNGEVFNAYLFIVNLVKSAKKSIILFDNYIDETVLVLLSKNQEVEITIYTHTFSKQLQLDIQKYNEQYKSIKVESFKDTHDRFLILDEEEIYHIGASLKDLGKKWFAFSKMDRENISLLEKVEK